MTLPIIRDVAISDAEHVTALLNTIIEDGRFTAMVDPLSVDDYRAFIRDLPRRAAILVAVDEGAGTILGTQELTPVSDEERALAHVAEIATFVSESARGKGVGSALMQEMLSRAAGMGYKKICAQIRADNHNAQGFYQSKGFERIGIARDHVLIGGVYMDEIFYERFIP